MPVITTECYHLSLPVYPSTGKQHCNGSYLSDLLSFLIQLPLPVLHWVYGFSLGRGGEYSFWLRQLRQCVLSLRAGKAGPTHHSRPAPGHRATAWNRPGVNKQPPRSFGVLAPQFQAPAANLHRAIRCQSPLPAPAEFQASVEPRCNCTPAALQYHKTPVRLAAVDGVLEP